MIKHCASRTFSYADNQQEGNTIQFQTFQRQSVNSPNRDSLCFTQSIHNQQKNKEQTPMMNKQVTIQSQLLKSMMLSSNRKHKYFDTLKQESLILQKNPLGSYVINPFQAKLSQKNELSDKKAAKRMSLNPCCMQIQQAYKTKLKFLTNNNQQLYEVSVQLEKDKSELATQIKRLREQITCLKQVNERLKVQNGKMSNNCESLYEQFKKREALKLRQVKNNIQNQQQQMKIVYKLTHLLEKKKLSEQNKSLKDQLRFNRSNNNKDVVNYEVKRSKTEYFQKKQEDNKVQQRSASKSNKANLVRQTNIQDQLQQKFVKLSQQKKRKVETMSRQKIVMETVSTQLPSTVLEKMGKGKVGKLVEAKSAMASSKLLYGKNSSSSFHKKKNK